MNENPRFKKLLIESGLLSEYDAENLWRKFEGDALKVYRYLVDGGAAAPGQLGRLWAESIGVSYIDLSRTLFQSACVERLPVEFARSNRVIPIYQFGPAYTIATSQPFDKKLLSQVSTLMKGPVSPVFATNEEIEDAIEIQYQSTTILSEFLSTITARPSMRTQVTAEQLKAIAEDEAVQEFNRGLILLALRQRASDIHLEPEELSLRVRFRIDGVLQEKMRMEIELLRPIVSALKINAGLDITERRQPQDGRIKLAMANRAIDLRLSTMPTIYGEKAVLRVLGQMTAKEAPRLGEINLSRRNLALAERIVSTPNGVFFVTGPTGSGKTTTLFSVLRHLNNPQVNIVTVEDPVEYRLPGVNQVQVDHESGRDFARVLRAFLRQDPNVILIGEIRDSETAKIASQAALTGHLVLATMHTNNALQAVTRLIEIGVEPFLVAPSIIGVMSQRLVRRICVFCKQRYLVPDDVKEANFTGRLDQELYAWRGTGCPECNQTGYSGRIAIHELFIMTERIRSMVARGESVLELEKAAREAGFKTLRHDGLKKVLRGLTTFEEIDRVSADYE